MSAEKQTPPHVYLMPRAALDLTNREIEALLAAGWVLPGPSVGVQQSCRAKLRAELERRKA